MLKVFLKTWRCWYKCVYLGLKLNRPGRWPYRNRTDPWQGCCTWHFEIGAPQIHSNPNFKPVSCVSRNNFPELYSCGSWDFTKANYYLTLHSITSLTCGPRGRLLVLRVSFRTIQVWLYITFFLKKSCEIPMHIYAMHSLRSKATPILNLSNMYLAKNLMSNFSI